MGHTLWSLQIRRAMIDDGMDHAIIGAGDGTPESPFAEIVDLGPYNRATRDLAQRIVQAVNANDALVAALQFVAAHEELTGPADKQYFSAGLLAKCRAALAKARGE